MNSKVFVEAAIIEPKITLMFIAYLLYIIKIWKFLLPWALASSVLKNSWLHELQSSCGSNHLWDYNDVDAFKTFTTIHFPTIHFVCRRAIVQSGSHWIRLDIIQNKHLTSQSNSINWNFVSILIENQIEINIRISKFEKWKNVNFIFQKINILNYTFHTRIKFKCKVRFSFFILISTTKNQTT